MDTTAHPLLDPAFLERPSRLRRFLRGFYERIRQDDDAYRRAVAAQIHPPGAPSDWASDSLRLAEILQEADAYIREIVNLLPSPAEAHARPADCVTACDDLRDLITLVVTHPDPRVRFEARRKLYLMRLFLQVDQSRHIQDGPRHKAFFEELLQQGLWRHARQVHEVEIGYNIDATGQAIQYNLRPSGPAALAVPLECPRARRPGAESTCCTTTAASSAR